MPNQGRRRSAARLLAPVALLLAIGAVLVVVQSSTQSDGSDDDGGRQPTAGQETEQQTTTGSEPSRPRRASYTVKLNDTLGLISEKTGVSVERLQDLNPELDPQNLIVGQKVKLRE